MNRLVYHNGLALIFVLGTDAVMRMFKRLKLRSKSMVELFNTFLYRPVYQHILIRRMRSSSNSLKLHIGCGGVHLDGFINIDKYPVKAADLVLSGDKLPFNSNSVVEIFSSHVIEHISRTAFPQILREWHRVLRPGGTLTIRCPNFELYVREWLEADYEYRWGWGITNLFGHDDRGEGMRHRTGFTVKRLSHLLSENGFDVVVCSTTETRPQFRGTVEYRPNGDIYCEAIKSSA